MAKKPKRRGWSFTTRAVNSFTSRAIARPAASSRLFGSGCTPGADTEKNAFSISRSSIMRSVSSTDHSGSSRPAAAETPCARSQEA
jgi:hypothetical protein